MRKLRQRPRSDTSVNQPRRAAGTMGRRVYLVLLALLAVALGNYIWGDMLFLRADGLVLRERALVEATSTIRVEEVAVRRGQGVSAGQTLLKVGSIEILERIADYASRNAELVEREAALRSRANIVGEILPLADKRMNETSRMVQELQDLKAKSIVSSQRLEEVTAVAYTAQTEFVRLSSEKESLVAEIEAIAQARAHSLEALSNLEEYYANGIVSASKSGQVGEIVPSVGEVFRAGDSMLSVISGDAYVLVYLPTNYWFQLDAGMKVEIANGRQSAVGYISEILPVSQSVPPEFQQAFRPDQTRQLARVEFEEPSLFPTAANVRVTRPNIVHQAYAWLKEL